MPDKEKDTSSLITTGARTFPVFDDTGDYDTTVQTFGQERATEAAAIEAAMNPQSDNESDEAQAARLKSLGFEQCQKCYQWKELDKFSPEPANTGRQCCHSWCKSCVSTYVQTKRQIVRDGKRADGYRYQERKRKHRGRPRKSSTM